MKVASQGGAGMLLDLSRIRSAHEQYEKTYSAGAIAQGDEQLTVVEPVSLMFDIFKGKAQFRLVGRTATVLELRCSRCLEPFRFSVDAPFELHYQPRATNAGEGEREIEEEDLSTAFYEDDTIDLGQLMREQFYLALPMKPLCQEDCRGLCTVCGTNLNRGQCDCKRESEDPRLAALKTLNRN